MAVSAPGLAGAYQQRLASAAAFLATKIPVKEDKDPFDPHPAPRLTDAQASTLVRYGNYVDRPQLFFEELERGKITPEGVEVVKTLMPGAFAELQQRTQLALVDMMARGQKPPFAQRERLGVLLDIPATAAQRPAHASFLQRNMLASEQSITGAPAPPKRPMPTKAQPSSLDRLEGR